MFAARHIPGQIDVRVGVDANGYSAIFFELRETGGRRRSFLMTSVRYDPVVACRFDEDATVRTCAVLRCTTEDTSMAGLFFRIVESWLPTIPDVKVGVSLDEAVGSLVDLFDALSRPGRGEVLGLWGELFLMCMANQPNEVVRAWRSDPFDLHDFVSGLSRLEVKTTTSIRRHHFSLSQLQPPEGTTLTICSIVAKASARGFSIDNLREILAANLKDPILLFRVERTIVGTLGDRWRETATQKYLLDATAGGVLFFDGARVPRVDPRLPPEVSGVVFTVECDGLPILSEPRFPGVGTFERINHLSLG